MTRGRFVVGARWLVMLRRSGKGASRAIWIADDASDKRYCTGHTTAERFNSPTLGVMFDPPRLDSFLGLRSKERIRGCGLVPPASQVRRKKWGTTSLLSVLLSIDPFGRLISVRPVVQLYPGPFNQCKGPQPDSGLWAFSSGTMAGVRCG